MKRPFPFFEKIVETTAISGLIIRLIFEAN